MTREHRSDDVDRMNATFVLGLRSPDNPAQRQLAQILPFWRLNSRKPARSQAFELPSHSLGWLRPERSSPPAHADAPARFTHPAAPTRDPGTQSSSPRATTHASPALALAMARPQSSPSPDPLQASLVAPLPMNQHLIPRIIPENTSTKRTPAVHTAHPDRASFLTARSRTQPLATLPRGAAVSQPTVLPNRDPRTQDGTGARSNGFLPNGAAVSQPTILPNRDPRTQGGIGTRSNGSLPNPEVRSERSRAEPIERLATSTPLAYRAPDERHLVTLVRDEVTTQLQKKTAQLQKKSLAPGTERTASSPPLTTPTQQQIRARERSTEPRLTLRSLRAWMDQETFRSGHVRR